MVELWEEALRQLKERVGKQSFETWIQPIKIDAMTADSVVLGVPNKFFRDWLTEHYFTGESVYNDALTFASAGRLWQTKARAWAGTAGTRTASPAVSTAATLCNLIVTPLEPIGLDVTETVRAVLPRRL
mgnify:CR=1 FL=1